MDWLPVQVPIALVTIMYVALCVVMSMKWCETMEGNVPTSKEAKQAAAKKNDEEKKKE